MHEMFVKCAPSNAMMGLGWLCTNILGTIHLVPNLLKQRRYLAKYLLQISNHILKFTKVLLYHPHFIYITQPRRVTSRTIRP